MLQQVLDQIHTAFPALAGHVCQHTTVQNDLAAQLLSAWQQRESDAGKSYWAARSWSMLIWQPAYLSVFAVHLAQCNLDLRTMQQSQLHGVSTGFSLPEQSVQRGIATIVTAAQQLQAYHLHHYREFSAMTPYSAKQAACMSVDCVLSALLALQPLLAWRISDLYQAAEHWLSALGWQRHGQLMTITLDDGATHTTLQRQGCCQHFRLPGQTACSTCPRWPMPLRLEKIKHELLNTPS